MTMDVTDKHMGKCENQGTRLQRCKYPDCTCGQNNYEEEMMALVDERDELLRVLQLAEYCVPAGTDIHRLIMEVLKDE
jgi:hypothetical protein